METTSKTRSFSLGESERIIRSYPYKGLTVKGISKPKVEVFIDDVLPDGI